MDSYPVSEALKDLLNRKRMGAQPVGAGAARNSGKGPGVFQPGQFPGRRSVNADPGGKPNGFDYGAHVGTAMAHTAMSKWRIIRQRPLLMIAKGGKA